ncbi:MAG: imidazoleglycerol-phosphate dehydratase [Betaproteobacteria bacterium TMED82]|nr:MAG: imidazoleglycerol-phosphate dehydratase [Betaproteobacteria bacterium TMED82]|tara:strand:- start:6119 stop:6706 length:588 start_codon:yes stop_codon:yes gene_type:complete
MRTAKISRKTGETLVEVTINLDSGSSGCIDTGLPFFDHMLDQIRKHGNLDVQIVAKGDLQVDPHHTVEDVGITLGQALKKALGDMKSIKRFAAAYAPLDEALSRSVLDISGRPGLEFRCKWKRGMAGNFDLDLIHEFFQGFVNHAFVTLHIDNLAGENAHHQCESVFKSFALALKTSIQIDRSIGSDIPSTKGVL